MRILFALFRIIRPHNCLIGGLSVLIAALVAGVMAPWQHVFYAIFSSMLITAGANTINDWYDFEIDRINRPGRVLPAGLLPRRLALALAAILFVCGIIFSIFINFYAVMITSFSSIILVLYSAVLKGRVLWGNLAVSFISGLAFIFGALAAGSISNGVVPALLAFQFHLGREIIKDMEDVVGDAGLGARTLAVVYGDQVAKYTAIAVFCFLVAFTFVPYFLQIYSALYLIAVVIGVDFVILSIIFMLWRDSSQPRLKMYSIILKFDMLAGLLAIYIGK